MSHTLVHTTYVVATVVMVLFSWLRNRNLLHPHFMFTVMLCVSYSDFLVRGYDDPMTEVIPQENLFSYQLIIIGVFFILSILTNFIRARECEVVARSAWAHVTITKSALLLLQTVAWILLSAELAKRLSTVDWSAAEMIVQMSGPRFARNWDLLQYNGNFLFAIIGLLIPLMALAFAYVMISAKVGAACTSSLGYLAAMAILVTDGSRTPVAICLAGPVAFVLLSNKARIVKLVVAATASITGAAVLSFMYLFRASGYISGDASSPEFHLTYHQDDSYYRALWSYYYSDISNDSWDLVTFVISIISNPIPRFFWADKPTLDEQYYGGFKVWYTTMLFMGEVVALFGTMWAPLVSIGVGICIYTAFYKSVSLLRYPFGIVAYMLVALYVYMTMRSLQNLTMFIYLPAFAVVLTRAFGNPTSHANRNEVYRR